MSIPLFVNSDLFLACLIEGVQKIQVYIAVEKPVLTNLDFPSLVVEKEHSRSEPFSR